MAEPQSNTEKNEVQAFWNDFSNYYGSTLEDYSLKSALALSKMLRLSSAKNILEVGCATGSLSLHLLHFLPPGTTYTAIDFSETMIKTAQQRKESLKQKLNDVNHTFRVGDAEDLSFVPSESVDVYISPLCLHLVPNIEKALSEALRVTKKGGRIGFSILGPFEKNSFYSVFDSNVYEVVKQRPPVPMIPHLLDKEKAVELAQKAGITVDFCWEEETAYDIFSEKELENIQRNSAYAKMFREASEDVQAKIMEGVKVDFDKLKNNFTPLKTNNLLLVGRKPE